MGRDQRNKEADLMKSSTGKSKQDHDYLFKIVIVGSSGSGKTSLLLRYVDDTFSSHYISTIGVDFKVKTEEDILGSKVKLQMWDTAGQDRFRCIAASFYRCADAIIIVYDVTDAQSLVDAEGWLAEARRYGPPSCKAVLLGNKADDLEGNGRQVDESAGKAFAERLGIEYLETSAKTGRNVNLAYTKLAEELVTNRRETGGGYLPGELERSHLTGSLRLDGMTHGPVTADKPGWCFGQAVCSTL